MGLIICPRCQRHIRAEDMACPFCAASAAGGIAIAAMLALAGCGSKQPAPAAPPSNVGEATPDAGAVDQPPPPPDQPYEPQPQPLYGVDRN